MKEKKSTNDSDKTSENNNNFEELIRKQDIALANLEKVGLFFLLYGYSLFVVGANLDILEALDINNTGYLPDTITLYGQQLILTGYIILFIVASNRIAEKAFRNEVTNENHDLGPYKRIANAYFLSIIANSLRVKAFEEIEILILNNKEE
ncbi:MAG: hypothetical protein MJ191_06215 [Clostridium sp.]|nr:hypothetical protein [Clostridium sp.]